MQAQEAAEDSDLQSIAAGTQWEEHPQSVRREMLLTDRMTG